MCIAEMAGNVTVTQRQSVHYMYLDVGMREEPQVKPTFVLAVVTRPVPLMTDYFRRSDWKPGYCFSRKDIAADIAFSKALGRNSYKDRRGK